MYASKILIGLIAFTLTFLASCTDTDYFAKGMKLYNQDKFLSANIQFTKSVNAGIKVEEALFYKSMCLIEIDSLDKASYILAFLYRKSDIDKGQLLFNLGHIFNVKGDYDKSFDYFYTALALGYKIKLLNTNIGIALLNSGKCRRAIPYFRRDCGIAHPSKTTLLALSDAYLCVGMADSANYFKRSAEH